MFQMVITAEHKIEVYGDATKGLRGDGENLVNRQFLGSTTIQESIRKEREVEANLTCV